MNEKYKDYTVREIFAEISHRDKAIAIYRAVNPELSEEEIAKDFDIEEEFRSRSVFDIFCMGSSMVGGFDESDAVDVYLEMHPEANPADIRSELDKAIADDDHGAGSLPDIAQK